MTRNFYRNSDGVIVVYDVTKKSSLLKVQEWIDSVSDNTDKNVRMILIGNKIDMPREVSKEEGKKMADNFGIKYFETSAKDNEGITESMQAIIYDVVQDKKPKKENNINLGQIEESSSSSKCSC